jgi:predicted RecA/RadA family phage recombinase
MQAQFIQDGSAVDITPEIDIAVGSIVIVGDLVGITKRDLKAGVLGSIAVEGIFDVPKDPSQAVAFTAGQRVYVDTDGEPLTTATGNKYLGKAVQAAAADSDSVRIRLSP